MWQSSFQIINHFFPQLKTLSKIKSNKILFLTSAEISLQITTEKTKKIVVQKIFFGDYYILFVTPKMLSLWIFISHFSSFSLSCETRENLSGKRTGFSSFLWNFLHNLLISLHQQCCRLPCETFFFCKKRFWNWILIFWLLSRIFSTTHRVYICLFSFWNFKRFKSAFEWKIVGFFFEFYFQTQKF